VHTGRDLSGAGDQNGTVDVMTGTARIISVLVIAVTLTACGSSSTPSASHTTPASSTPPSVAQPPAAPMTPVAPVVPAPPPTPVDIHDGPLGTTITASTQSGATNGAETTGTASYTVSNLRRIRSAQSSSGTGGTFYAVTVTVRGQRGVTMVHPWNFSVRTTDGTTLAPDLMAAPDGLPATDLRAGQKVSGSVAVQVPNGQAVTEILLTAGIGGEQLGRWTVG